jgi:hypothetical protein
MQDYQAGGAPPQRRGQYPHKGSSAAPPPSALAQLIRIRNRLYNVTTPSLQYYYPQLSQELRALGDELFLIWCEQTGVPCERKDPSL